MAEHSEWERIAGHYLCSVGDEVGSVLERLSDFQYQGDYTEQVEPVLLIMGICRPWLQGPAARRLADAAYSSNDAIDQQLEFHGIDVLPSQVRAAAGGCEASDMEAVSAFVLACAAHALQALTPILQAKPDDVVEHLARYRLYLEAIWPVWECAGSARLSLDADAIAACHRIAELAGTASNLTAFAVDGHFGAEVRRQLDGVEARDLAIRVKALELIRAGTKLHNLSSKLRAWQQRETGQALSKPAMNAILKRYNLHS